MNERFDTRPRSAWDLVQFAVIFFGLLTTATGIVAMSAATAGFGFVLLFWGFGYFLIKQW